MFLYIFIQQCVCEYACVCVCSCTLMKLFSEGLNRGSRTLDLDLLLVISPLMWVVGTKVRSSKKTVNIVDCWAPAHFYYKQTKYNSLAKWYSHTHYEGNDGGTDLGKYWFDPNKECGWEETRSKSLKEKKSWGPVSWLENSACTHKLP